MQDDFFAKAHELVEQGVPFATAMVVRAEKPTSAKVGDRAIVLADGTLYGWIGGSCAEPTVVKEAIKAMQDGESRLIRLSPNPDQQSARDGLIEFPLTCFSGGTLEVYIQPQQTQPRLLIVGSSPTARTLADLGKLMRYQVVSLDLDDGGLEGADQTLSDLDQAAEVVGPNTAVVVATHGRYDELALEQVLKAKPAYVSLVSSGKRFEQVLDYLRAQGFDADDLTLVKAPAGLDIHARRGDEIALSIMAEIVNKRGEGGVHFEADELIAIQPASDAHPHHHHHEAADHEPATREVAVDPVCGMEVEVATARYTHEHEGRTYYFCAASCKMRFAENPGQYLSKDAPAGEAIDPVCKMTVDIATAQHMAEYDGAIYYFCAASCKEAFEKDPLKYVGVAEG
jgi:xanthine dehydrogenase accessory factor